MTSTPTRREAFMGAACAVLLSGLPAKVWAAEPDVKQAGLRGNSGKLALGRAEDALKLTTRYWMDLPVHPNASWPDSQDCSGFILWCFGFSRDEFGGGSTDEIYDDAVKRRLFTQTNEPRVGGIVIYPGFTLPGERHDSGHVALIRTVTRKKVCVSGTLWQAGNDSGIVEALPLELIDCSSTSWWTYGNAVHVGDYNKFLLHDQLIKQAQDLPHKDADGRAFPASELRRPIYAVITRDLREASPPPIWRGRCERGELNR